MAVKIIVRIVVSLLILMLALASIANIHTRAIQLHANGGWQTWLISIGFAVSFALFSYLLIAHKKGFFGGAAIFCAALTGVMQTGMYLALGADWLTSLGFGCGGPILEALLAMSEHYMDEPVKRGAPSPVWGRIGNAIATRIERGAEPLPQPVANPVSVVETVAEPVALQPQPSEVRRAELLRILGGIVAPEDINKAELGRTFNVSSTQINKDIKKLIDAGHLSINGKVQVHQ
jgi:hypothetical protein